MRIISHRGYWLTHVEKNTRLAFERSFSHGFGTETDFRDRDGRLVISHDLARDDALDASDFFSLLAKMAPSLPLAINIKADGLQSLISRSLDAAGVTNYFLFDMSVPDAIQSIKAGLRVYTRHSDYEPVPAYYSEAAGVWMDEFEPHGWLTMDKVESHLARGKAVCLVSPELHGRPQFELWRAIARSTLVQSDQLALCTDFPCEAQAFFAQ